MASLESVNLAINAIVDAKANLENDFAGNPGLADMAAYLDEAAAYLGEVKSMMEGSAAGGPAQGGAPWRTPERGEPRFGHGAGG